MRLRSKTPIVLLVSITVFGLLYLSSNKHANMQAHVTEADPRVRPYFDMWRECIERNISIYENDAIGLWSNLWKAVKLCETLPFIEELRIRDFHNSDETKRHILPSQREPSRIVTLGIGADIAAEEALAKLLPAGSEFYGADPVHEVNEELYTKLGIYFPFAVGAKSKLSTASVLVNYSYEDRTVIHIDLIYFLSEIIGHKVYDDLWIDTEGAEYEMFPYFYQGGKLDQHSITLCQFNMEVHRPNDEQKELFRQFIFETLKGNRYVFLRPVQGHHIRLYFLNFSDKHCVSKYIIQTAD